ncbi:hypothetical protein D3C81_1966980 [compost metagenome]
MAVGACPVDRTQSGLDAAQQPGFTDGHGGRRSSAGRRGAGGRLGMGDAEFLQK